MTTPYDASHLPSEVQRLLSLGSLMDAAMTSVVQAKADPLGSHCTFAAGLEFTDRLTQVHWTIQVQQTEDLMHEEMAEQAGFGGADMLEIVPK